MGLLWRFMAFSPTVQVLAGLAEVAAAAFLLFRRAAWLGVLLAAIDLTVVFLLNLTFDVPVKQLSGIMAVAGIILLIPNLPRLCRFLVGKPTGAIVARRISTNRIFVAVTRWTGPLLAIAMLLGSGAVVGNMTDWARSDQPSEIAGVYTVSGDSRPDVSGSQLTQAAFGQLTKAGSAAVGLRWGWQSAERFLQRCRRQRADVQTLLKADGTSSTAISAGNHAYPSTDDGHAAPADQRPKSFENSPFFFFGSSG